MARKKTEEQEQQLEVVGKKLIINGVEVIDGKVIIVDGVIFVSEDSLKRGNIRVKGNKIIG